MTYQADSIIQKARRNSNEAKNIANDIKNTLDQKADSVAEEKGNKEEKKQSEERTSTPDKGAIFVNKIGWVVAILIVLIVGAWWFFGIGRRKREFGTNIANYVYMAQLFLIPVRVLHKTVLAVKPL